MQEYIGLNLHVKDMEHGKHGGQCFLFNSTSLLGFSTVQNLIIRLHIGFESTNNKKLTPF